MALASDRQPIILSDFSPQHAHTLVHHLYTGKFERKGEYSPMGLYIHSTRLYCAAVRYEIPSLVDVSKREIIQTGKEFDMSSILQIATACAFPDLPESDTWYTQYLQTVVQKAMKSDPEQFKNPEIMELAGRNSRLLGIVWTTVMSSLTATLIPARADRSADSGAATPLAESALTESEVTTQDSQHQLPSPTGSVVDSPPRVKVADESNEPESLDLGSSATSDFDYVPHSKLQEAVASNRGDTTSNDDFDLPDIEPITNSVAPSQSTTAPEKANKKPEHIRADSVVEIDAVEPDSAFATAKREAVDEAPLVQTSGTQEFSKKNKKKNKKKHSSIVF